LKFLRRLFAPDIVPRWPGIGMETEGRVFRSGFCERIEKFSLELFGMVENSGPVFGDPAAHRRSVWNNRSVNQHYDTVQ
jgi:hypothetical protein